MTGKENVNAREGRGSGRNEQEGRRSGRKELQRMTGAAMFFALGIVLPFATMHIQTIGKMLSPMHFPVLLCGFVCGWKYGLAVGFLLPLIRSLLFQMPPMFPGAVAMAFELATYGAAAGALYTGMQKKGILSVYGALIPAMLAGRLVWGAAQYILLGISGKAFPFQAFLSGAVTMALPGIFLQLLLIPLLMLAMGRAGLIPFSESISAKGSEQPGENRE